MHGYDIDAIVKALQELSAKAGRKLVSLPASKIESAAAPMDTASPEKPPQHPALD